MTLIERNERAIYAIDLMLQSNMGKMSESVLKRIRQLLIDNIDFIKSGKKGD